MQQVLAIVTRESENELMTDSELTDSDYEESDSDERCDSDASDDYDDDDDDDSIVESGENESESRTDERGIAGSSTQVERGGPSDGTVNEASDLGQGRGQATEGRGQGTGGRG